MYFAYMVTKEEIKKEVDKLPDNLLEIAYALLRNITGIKKSTNKNWTIRDFKGKLDKPDIRSAAYE